MLRTCSSSALSAASAWRVMRKPNTISDAIENNSSPPAMRNAGSEIDSMRSSQSPISADAGQDRERDQAGAQRDADAAPAAAGRR